MTDREKTLMLAILKELANTPNGYRQPHPALCASLRLSVCPAPEQEEIDSMLAILEAEAYVNRAASLLTGKTWQITEQGREALQNA